MIIENLFYYNLRKSNTFVPPVFMDSPNECLFGKDWWNDYKIKDYCYKFNSWAFRGDEYAQYIGKPVNICLGDSFTVNIGGPVEHSWSYQLSKYFDLPTINLGVDGAGNDTIKLIYQKACEIFDVQKTFVMYSYFHRRLIDNELKKIITSDEENFNFFNENFINDAFFTFVPKWAWSDTELAFLYKTYKDNIIEFDCLNKNFSVDQTQLKKISKKEYNLIKGSDWPDYKNFVQLEKINPLFVDELSKISNTFLRLTSANRDGYHLNYSSNKIVADYFYKKTLDNQQF